jgi:hypothetical protein
MTVLDFGKFLRQLFKDDLSINIYPIVAENSTLKSYAIYERVSTTHRHKDRQLDGARFNIYLIAEQYNESVNMLQKVIDACNRVYDWEGEHVRLGIDDASESYSDAYVQQAVITISV